MDDKNAGERQASTVKSPSQHHTLLVKLCYIFGRTERSNDLDCP